MGWLNDQPSTLTIPAGAGPTQPRVVIGAAIPAELAAFYLSRPTPFTVIEATLYYAINGSDYAYQALTVRGANVLSLVQGDTYSGVVRETSRIDITSATTSNTFFEANKLTLQDSALTKVLLGAALNSDNSADRFQLLVSGALKWGPGGDHVPLDTTLYRGGAGQLVADSIVWNNAGTAEPWNPMTLQNGWTNFGAGFVTANYRRVAAPADSVHIVGVIAPGTKVDGTIIANLPAIYRPAATILFPVGQDGGAASNQRMSLSPAGDLKIFGLNLAGLTAAEINEILPLTVA